MLSAISGRGEWAVTVFDVSLARSIGTSCRLDGAIISSAGFRIAQGGRFLKGVLRGGGVTSEASWLWVPQSSPRQRATSGLYS
jgi:hypothetical protein